MEACFGVLMVLTGLTRNYGDRRMEMKPFGIHVLHVALGGVTTNLPQVSTITLKAFQKLGLIGFSPFPELRIPNASQPAPPKALSSFPPSRDSCTCQDQCSRWNASGRVRKTFSFHMLGFLVPSHHLVGRCQEWTCLVFELPS